MTRKLVFWGAVKGARVTRPAEPAARAGGPAEPPAVPARSESPGAAADPALWVCTPCKGRLSFVRQTLGHVLADPRVRVCLVDYSCPDGVGDWAESNFRSEAQSGRLVVERVPGQRLFNKSSAHNAGARRALREGARYLCFLDADTVVKPGFFDSVIAQLAPERFLIAGLRDDGSDMPSMTGLLVVHESGFQRVGGFDEEFVGWGGEDVELRLRLFLLGGLAYADVPLDLAWPIPHPDELRSQFYEEQNIASSNYANMQRIQEHIARNWRGRLVCDVRAAARLWFQPAFRGLAFERPPLDRALLRPSVAPPEPVSEPCIVDLPRSERSLRSARLLVGRSRLRARRA